MSIEEKERRLEDVKVLIKIWNRFYQILMVALRGEVEIPNETEQEFQRIKTTVAEKHDSFMKVVDKDEHIAQNVLSLVKRVISLVEFRRLSVLEKNNLIKEWHEANLLLYETLGDLEWLISEAGQAGERELRKAVKGTFWQRVKDVTLSPWFKRIVIWSIILIIIGVIVAFWKDISAHPIYKDHIARFVDPLIRAIKRGLRLEE